MLYGNNNMDLNPKTLMEMVQYYFEHVLFTKGKAPIVVGIKADTAKNTYIISLTERCGGQGMHE